VGDEEEEGSEKLQLREPSVGSRWDFVAPHAVKIDLSGSCVEEKCTWGFCRKCVALYLAVRAASN
jgi:hypothetical protein